MKQSVSTLMLTMVVQIGISNSSFGDSVDFAKEVWPVLEQNCVKCHGAEKQKGGFRLDHRAAAMEGGDYGASIIPGKPAESHLLAMVRGDEPDEIMPPKGDRLTKAQIDLLSRWIAQGAKWPADFQVAGATKPREIKHWSFRPVKKPVVPVATEWGESPIDAFVFARMKTKGLKPSPEADRYTLLRRLALDLTGLPPTPEEADAFVNDKTDGSYERQVDRLLASPAYGEHWASMWLDLARYADSKGYEKDKPRMIWRYRDWVIQAFNEDKPYDQFTIEQLAGDLLPAPTLNQRLATAFHRNTMTNDEGGTDNEEFRVAAVKDRVDTTMQVWMGLTMGCAQCHTHKYDPITLREYYSFYAFFNQTADRDLPSDAPHLSVPTVEQLSQLEALKTSGKSRQEIKRLKARINKRGIKTPVMVELPEAKRRTTRIHRRGSFLDQGDIVQGAVPVAFGKMPNGAPKNRLGVAKWIVRDDNPLTARVHANRIWARLFGLGIVETEGDFGTQGTAPSHPELLDWLAHEFINQHDWSQKKLIKTIVMSATYRQRADFDANRLAKDQRNQYLARGPRFRLSAESIRDQMLAASGLLTEKLYGPSVMPPQPDGIWRAVYSQQNWKTAEGPDRYRRGIYTFWRRTSPYPAMMGFDAGSREVCQIRRIRTNTPLQALIMLNDPVYIEAAGALAKKAVEMPVDRKAKAEYIFRRLVIRLPEAREVSRLLTLQSQASKEFKHQPGQAEELLKSARIETGKTPANELAAWVVTANAILNLDEGVMKP